MEQGNILFSIPFRPLLSKICSALGFAAPIFNSKPCSVHDCYVLVCTNEPQGLVYFGGDEGSFEDSAERASKKMVLHLVKAYKLRIDDVNLGVCDEFEHALHVFELKRKQLERVEKGIPSMPAAEWTSETAIVRSAPLVCIDFFELLSEIVSRLQIFVTRVEYLQFGLNDFIALMSIKCPGGVTDTRWIQSERHGTKDGARQCLARKVIRELMAVYRFKVDDVNYSVVQSASLNAKLERKSFLALRERVYEVIGEAAPNPFLQQEMELTPRSVESIIPKSTIAPKPPKKRPYPSSSRSFCNLIPDSAIPCELGKVVHRKRFESR